MSKQIRVLDRWDLSDHYPIMNILDGRKYTTPSVEVKERMKISRGDKRADQEETDVGYGQR